MATESESVDGEFKSADRIVAETERGDRLGFSLRGQIKWLDVFDRSVEPPFPPGADRHGEQLPAEIELAAECEAGLQWSVRVRKDVQTDEVSGLTVSVLAIKDLDDWSERTWIDLGAPQSVARQNRGGDCE